jgi:hypothetical protein
MSEKRLRKRLFSLSREEVTGGWRKLHNEKLHNLNSSNIAARATRDGIHPETLFCSFGRSHRYEGFYLVEVKQVSLLPGFAPRKSYGKGET